ncbi:MAG: cytosine methyltransferase [Streptosporangiaceae bacterium]|nr:cytosine methyltransferase [Streptosporangiaceae bacterium]
MAVKVLEGFAGPGGFSEGARMVGLADMLGVEMNADACASARAAGHERLEADIRSLNPGDFPDVSVWASAPPCPTYTQTGKQSGVQDYPIVLEGVARLGDSQANTAHDDAYADTYNLVSDGRTALVLETLKFAFRLPNVRVVVAEQVPPVRGIWEEMAAALAAAYDFESCNVITVRADDLGAATRRIRAFLVATRDYTPDFAGLPMRSWWSCGRFEPPQIRLPNLMSPFPKVSMAQALGWPTGIRINTRGERKTAGGNEFSADGPAVSMTGNGLRAWYRTDLGKPDGLLTYAQAGLLQGFPADYPWTGGHSSKFQRIADTVSPLVGTAVIGAAAGLPWEDAVWGRLEHIYGISRPDRPRYRCVTDTAGSEQFDLFTEVAA